VRCIFCLRECPGSIEHIFPYAIGGCITIDRVCKECNDQLGSRVDVALCNDFFVRGRRADLALAGRGGEAPPKYEMLLGEATLACNPEQRVLTTYDKSTGKIDTKTLPSVIKNVEPDGTTKYRIIVDSRDTQALAITINRLRKRHGVPLLLPDELNTEIERWKKDEILIHQPKLTMNRSYNFAFVRHSIIKIAYELAFLWLGDVYIDDEEAQDLRTAILSIDPASTEKLPAFVGSAEDNAAFHFWPPSNHHHLAYSFFTDDGIAIAVRLFDSYAAVVWVTKDARRYLSSCNVDKRLRFLSINAQNRTFQESSMTDELARISTEKHTH
jgi:HNH endonuclease